MINPFKRKTTETIKPCGIKSTVNVNPSNLNDVFLNANTQLNRLVNLPEESRFYLNKFKS
jgi:hypothetical protein